MKKKGITRKLIMSITTAAMTAVCLGTTTYAWFSRNSSTWLDDTEFVLASDAGLLISTDGVNYSQNITQNQIKQLITGKQTDEEAKQEYAKIGMRGVSITQDAGTFDASQPVFAYDTINHTDDSYISTITLRNESGDVDAEIYFETLNQEIKSVSAKTASGDDLNLTEGTDTYKFEGDGKTYIVSNVAVLDYVRSADVVDASNDEYKYSYESEAFKTKTISYVDNGYSHSTTDATENKDYITFSLYFEMISADSSKSYNLKFLDNSDGTYSTDENYTPEVATGFKSKALAKTALEANLTTYALDNGTASAVQYGPEIDGHKEITYDVANSMRLGVTGGAFENSMKIYEGVNEYDLGSAAIEGADESDYRHRKDYNAMYTYFNNLNPLYPFKEAASNGDAFDTDATYTDDVLGTFTYKDGEFNKIKLTFYIWLEGWDADYMPGTSVDASTISVNLLFGFE